MKTKAVKQNKFLIMADSITQCIITIGMTFPKSSENPKTLIRSFTHCGQCLLILVSEIFHFLCTGSNL